MNVLIVASLGTIQAEERLRFSIESEIERMSKRGLYLDIVEDRRRYATFFRCTAEIDEDDEVHRNQYLYVCRIFLAKAAAEYITGPVFDIWARKHLHKTRAELMPYGAAVNAILSGFRGEMGAGGRTTALIIRARVARYLEEYNEVNLWGFANFRLRDLKSEVCAIVDRQVERYLRQKDYDELVELLRYIVDIQEPRFDEVNVISENGHFRLLDRTGKNIETQYLDEFIFAGWDEVEPEDLLLSALITIAPRLIILHFSDKLDVAAIIKGIFGNRVRTCTGCKLCRDRKNRA